MKKRAGKSRRKIVVGMGGASGAIYAKHLLDALADLEDQYEQVSVVMTKNALVNWELEIGAFDQGMYPFRFYKNDNFQAPFASGSAQFDTMLVCPCSMGLLARIAHGISNDLISRAADVVLKERRKLILIPRETPLSLVHLRNMTAVTEAGAVVCPAIPSFYLTPQGISDIIDTVIYRALDLANFAVERPRWGE